MQLESPKELLLRMCVFPLKLWFVPHNCRQEGWHVLYRNLLHCQNPHSEFSKWTVLLEKYCVTKFIHTWKRQCNASKSKYFSWPDLSFRVLVSFSRQTDFQDLNIPSWLKTDKILAVLPFFSETWRLFHVFMLCQASLRQKLPSCVRADFSPPMPHTLRQPTENMVVATQGNAQLWQPESHPIPSSWLSEHWKQHEGHWRLMLLRKHSTSTSHQFLPFLTKLPSFLLFPPCWQKSFVLPRAAVLCRVPAATPSWLISSNSCSPLHASKQQSYF